MSRGREEAEIFGSLMQAMNSRPLLRAYDGKGPVEQFLAELTAVHHELDENDDICLRMLRQAMDGEARAFFNQTLLEDQRQNKHADLDEWIERLRERFKKPYTVQLSEFRSRKMKKGESATEYVDAMVGLAKSMTPPLPEEQIVIALYDNCLPRYKKTLLAMDPQTAEQFKIKLGRLMTIDDDEDTLVDKLTKVLEKSKTEEKKETATTLAVEAAPAQRPQSFQRRGGGGWHNRNFRGRGRGRGSSGFSQRLQQMPFTVAYGFQPQYGQPMPVAMPFLQQPQQYPQVMPWPQQQWVQQQWPQQQWQTQQQPLALTQARSDGRSQQQSQQQHNTRPQSRQSSSQPQQAYVVETPGPSSSNADQEVASFFTSHQGN